MTLSDYLLDSVLVLLVLRQLRESRLDRRAILLPLGIIGWAVHSYLHSIPTSGNNLVLIAGLTAVGVASGAVSALTTRVRSDGGKYALVKAGGVAAGIWVATMSARFAFAVWASHGGGAHLYRFGVTHHLSTDVWTAALVLMALGEVVTRIGILFLRSQRVLTTSPPSAPQPLTV